MNRFGPVSDALEAELRNEIHGLLFWLDQELTFAEHAQLIRWWRRLRGKTPDPIRLGDQQRWSDT